MRRSTSARTRRGTIRIAVLPSFAAAAATGYRRPSPAPSGIGFVIRNAVTNKEVVALLNDRVVDFA